MIYKVTLNGKNYEVEVEKGEAIVLDISDVSATTAVAPVVADAAAVPAVSVAPAMSGGDPLNAPMPGTILSVKVAAGQQVKKGQVLLVLEAMKMENEIVSPRDATIAQVVVTQGASVNAGDPMLLMA